MYKLSLFFVDLCLSAQLQQEHVVSSGCSISAFSHTL